MLMVLSASNFHFWVSCLHECPPDGTNNLFIGALKFPEGPELQHVLQQDVFAGSDVVDACNFLRTCDHPIYSPNLSHVSRCVFLSQSGFDRGVEVQMHLMYIPM